MNEVIRVEDLHRDYKTTKGWIRKKKELVHAVNGISFSVAQGEIFGLLGQNGAGKTTTIKMLTTLLAPTKGECKVLGYHTFGEEKFIRKRINFIFGGEMGVYRRLSARDNLTYFANLYKIPPKVSKERIESLLDLVQLQEKADLLVETYSKGMIQRLQIARGMINNPEVLFMDEPTVGLDPLGAKMLRNIIKELKKQGKTVLLTTHYMQEADELCDRIAMIKEGKLVALESPENIKKNTKQKRKLEITYLDLPAELAESIRQIKGIEEVCLEKNEEEQDLLIITCEGKQDILFPVMNLLDQKKVILLTQKEVSLEDAYICLMEGKDRV